MHGKCRKKCDQCTAGLGRSEEAETAAAQSTPDFCQEEEAFGGQALSIFCRNDKKLIWT